MSDAIDARPPTADRDPYVEPVNSTVDDWFGQDVERDAVDADRAMQEADGDADRAEEIFEERRQPHHSEFDVPAEVRVVSAHRTPQVMFDYARTAADRGLEVIIAGAGGAAHLPGMVASATPLPVIGVPVPLSRLDGLDSLLSIVQMPAGVPVATVSIGGGRNAGLLAVRILASSDPQLRARLVAFSAELAASVAAKDAALRELHGKVTGE